MFDQVLSKQVFCETLKTKGYSDTEIEEEWNRLQGAFHPLFIRNCYRTLSEADRRQLDQNIAGDSTPETVMAVVGDYLTSHPDMVANKENVLRQSAEEAYQLYVASRSQQNQQGGVVYES